MTSPIKLFDSIIRDSLDRKIGLAATMRSRNLASVVILALRGTRETVTKYFELK